MCRLPFPSVVLPGGGRLGIYPGLKTRLPGPGVGIGAGVSLSVCLQKDPL